MAAKYKNSPREEMPRSVWSATGIFIALGVLTMLMALLIYGAIQGVSSGPSSLPERAQELRATR